ncbi:unnamed protein product [Paramecium sonneborni]|uniref:Uncharacterized protein n=1 Tax=Paramecium sonneborni TaxID=65129 RepID=A0A8S1M2I3_9CILI|nr:unnamed protein product [Paramecium sonneborni]
MVHEGFREKSYLYHKDQSIISLKTSNYNGDYITYTPAYYEDKQLLAVQDRDSLIVWDLNKKQSLMSHTISESLMIVEGNSLASSTQSNFLPFSASANQSSILSFSANGTLYGLGRDQKLRCWNLQGNCKVILKPQIPLKAFQTNEEKQVIKAIGKDNLVYEYLFEEFTEIYFFGSKILNLQKLINKNQNYFKKKLDDQERKKSLNLIVKKTNQVKYKINQFSTKITLLYFLIVENNLLLDWMMGLFIFMMQVKGQQKKYGKPVCCKSFARSPILMVDCCSIKQSKLFTQENENLEKLFLQKGAIKNF